MANMKEEFQKLAGAAFVEAVQLISFFTVKRVVTLLIVGLALFVVCAPSDVPLTNTGETVACDGACPFPAKPPPPPIHTEVLSQENWSFTLIGDGWKPRDMPTDEIKVAMENHNHMCMVFVVKEPTTDSFGAYLISTIRGFAETGAIVDSVKVSMIGGRKFVLVQLDRDSEVVWLWISVKDGFGYGFTCGCEINVDAGAAQRDLCQSMADTFQIK